MILIASSTHIANAAKWSSTVRLSDKDNYAGYPVIDSNSNGDAYVAWMEAEGKRKTSYLTVKVSKYDYSKDRWDNIGVVDRTHRMVDIQKIAVDEKKNVFVLWKRGYRSDASLYVSRYSTNKKMWEKLMLYKGDSIVDIDPQLILDNQGNAHIFWEGTMPSKDRVYVRTFSIDNEMWKKTIMLYGNRVEHIFTPSVDIDEKGNILAVSKYYRISIEPFRIMSRLITRVFDNNKGIWLPIKIIKTKESSDTPYVISRSIGNAQMIWSESDKNDREYISARKYNMANNSWGKKINVSKPMKGEVDDVLLDMNNEGNAVVVWSRSNKKNFVINYNTYNAINGEWNKQRNIQEIEKYEICSDMDSDENSRFIMICGNGKRNSVRWLIIGKEIWKNTKELFVARRKNHVIFSRIAAGKYENAYAVWQVIGNWDELILGRSVYVSVYR